MNRTDFIKLGTTSCLSVLVANGMGTGLLGKSSSLDRWAARSRGRLSSRPEGYACTVRADRLKLGEALQELNKITDGDLHCAGNKVRAQFEGRKLEVILQSV